MARLAVQRLGRGGCSADYPWDCRLLTVGQALERLGDGRRGGETGVSDPYVVQGGAKRDSQEAEQAREKEERKEGNGGTR